MMHKRLTNYVVQDSDGNIVRRSTSLAPEDCSSDEQHAMILGLDIPVDDYLDRVHHKDVAVIIGPDGKFISIYDIHTGERFNAEDLPE